MTAALSLIKTIQTRFSFKWLVFLSGKANFAAIYLFYNKISLLIHLSEALISETTN